MLNGHNPDRARDALHSIPADCDRAAWVKAGMAFHAAGGDFDTFNDWSAQAESYNAQACKATWRSFKTAPDGVGAGALFGMARDNGWQDGNTQRPAPARAKPKPQEPPRKPAPGMSAAEVWERCIPATTSHDYIVSKGATGVPLDSLRVVPDGDPLRIMGEPMAGALVVPCMASDGSLSTLQFITAGATADRLKADGKTTKPNLPGHSVNGWFTVGEIKRGEPIYITEGIGTAWAVWMATGAAAVVCFGWGNVRKVATALRQRDADARLVLCPDTGKEGDADKIAAEVGAAVAKMPEGWPANSDLNDLFQSPDGCFDVVQQLLGAATEPPKPEPKVHPLARYVDIGGTPTPPRWVIPGFIGHGVGKTTALLPLAMTAAGLHGDDLMPRQWRHVVKAKTKRMHSVVIECLETLLHERWIHEVFVPAKERLHPRKSAFFVNLTTEEHESVVAGGALPADKLVIPASWKKAPVSIMPDAQHECAKSEGVDHA